MDPFGQTDKVPVLEPCWLRSGAVGGGGCKFGLYSLCLERAPQGTLKVALTPKWGHVRVEVRWNRGM